jgi:hypothetical protein
VAVEKLFRRRFPGKTSRFKPGGSFVLIAETYNGGPFRLLYGVVMPLLRAAFLSDEEHRNLLAQAGFVEVETKHLPGKNWICTTGHRPS